MDLSGFESTATLQQLRYFVAVAETGSYRSAAVGRTQPAVSRGIRELEGLLGARLFEPRERTRLTPFGREALKDARRALGEVKTLGWRAYDEGGAETLRGPLRLGTKRLLAETALPAMLARLRRRHPRLEVRVRSQSGDRLMAMLMAGDVEVVLSHARARPEGVVYLPLFRRRRFLVAAKGDRLMTARRLTAASLAARPLILPERGGTTAREVMERLSRRGPGGRLTIAMEVMGAEARGRYVRDGWGVAIVEEGAERGLDRRLAARPIPESILPAREVGIYYVKERYLSRAGRAFVTACRPK